jgi:hypothetical protein
VSVPSHTKALLLLIVLLLQVGVVSAQEVDTTLVPPEGVGFHAQLTARSMVVAPYLETDDRFSAALYPRSTPPLSGKLLYNPKVKDRGNFADNSLSFGMVMYQGVDLVPVSVDANQYYERRMKDNIAERWQAFGSNTVKQTQQGSKREGLSLGVNLPKRFDQMFGEGGANLRVSGYRRITFSGRSQWDDAAKSGVTKQSKFPALNMEQISRFSIQGTIGTKISVSVAQDNQTDIPLANRLILRYKGDDDDVLKTIEAGNTTLAIANTRFVGYSQSISGLFGIKAEAKVGNLGLTAIASQEKGSSESATVSAAGEENAEYIRDYYYLDARIFDLAYPGEIGPYDSVDVKVYQQELSTRNNSTANFWYLKAEANVNPLKDKSEVLMTQVDGDEYELLYGQDTAYCPIALVFYTSRYRAVGVRMEIKRFSAPGVPTGAIDTIGYTDDDQNIIDTLRIIMPLDTDNNPDHPAWKLMWRNCYKIPKSIDIADLDVKIFKGLSGREGTSSCLDYQKVDNVSQNPFIRILGLDQYNQTDQKIPDGKLDDRIEVFRPDWGMLIFPDRTPFISNRMFEDVNGTKSDTLALKMPQIYSYVSSTAKMQNSQYYLQISTKARSANIRLGHVNIIEGSERVMLNGQALVKGQGYEISYETGQVTLLTSDATDPNNDVKVEFQYAPFLALQKKTLLGMRAEYEYSEDLKFGATVLYKSDKAQERKPRVGQETSKAMVQDFDINFGLNPRFVTNAIDALPGISAEADSRIKVSAEVAQSKPNPNVDGTAYIDDFESAVELQSLGNIRTNWTLSSEPLTLESSSNVWTRGTIRWHNPPAISKEEVYDIQTTAGQGALQPLRLIFRPHGFAYSGPSETPCIDSVPARSWGGIMRYFANRVDEDRVQLFEIRAKGGRGVLHFDFGKISEDVDGNGKPNTEDLDGNEAVDVVDGIDEDTGLDTLLDANEKDECGNGYDADDNPDPAHDNWWFDGDGKGVGNDNRPPVPETVWANPDFRNAVASTDNWLHYEWENGTEGNVDDAAVQGLPDKEMLGGFSLEENNAYFTFELRLDTLNGKYLVDGSGRNGWYTYRVPIRDPGVLDTVTNGETVSWSTVTHVRVWFEKDSTEVDSLASMDSIWIADWGFVQSNWTDTLMTSDSDQTSQFFVASVSEDDGTFTPPPGVEAYVDKVNNTTESQRGLSMVFNNLQPGAEGIARKDLLTSESYSGYRRLQMFVHGDPALDYSDSLMFFFRLGLDSANYYEYRCYVESGWSTRNDVVIDFNDITALKDKAEQAKKSSRGTVEDSTAIYRVVGKPNINEILFLSASVENMSHKAVSGEVWLDELRVTDVRRDVGTAARVTVNGSLSDIISYSGTYEHKDAYFRGLAQAIRGGSSDNLGSGKEVNDISLSTTFNINRFLPRSWGARLPITYSYAESQTIPILRSNSDVVLPPETRESEKSVSRSVKLGTSESFMKKGGGLLFDVLLNRQKVTASYSRTHQRSVNNPYMLSENYNFRGDYDMGVTKPPEVPVFFFTKSVPILKKISSSKLSLYPKKWLWNATFNRSLSVKDDADYNRTSSFSRTLDGRMDLLYQMFPTMSFDYTMGTKRDMTDPNMVNLSFRDTKLGLENSYNQTLRLSYDPKLFEFLTSAYGYSASYNDNYERSTKTRSTSLTTGWSVQGELKHQMLFANRRKPLVAGRTTPTTPTVRGGIKPEDEKASKQGKPFYEPALKGMRFLTGWLMPVRYQYSKGFSRSIPGVANKLPWQYRFGLDNYAVFPIIGSSRNPSAGESKSLDLSSGFTLLGGFTTTIAYKTDISQSLTTVGTDRTKSINTSFPEMAISIKRFTKLPLFKKYVNWFIDVFSPRTSYSRQVKTVENVNRGFRLTRNETVGHSPLMALNLKVFNRLSLSGSYGITQGTEEKSNPTTGKPESETLTTKKTVGVSSKYSFSAPTGLSIPLLGKLKFKSMVSIDMSVQYSSNLVQTAKQGGDFKTFTNTSSFSASPVISYTFSNQIRGGLTARWQDTNDVLRHKKSHVREIQIWTEIHF